MAIKLTRTFIYQDLDSYKNVRNSRDVKSSSSANDFEKKLLSEDKVIAYTREEMSVPETIETKNYFFKDKESLIIFLLDAFTNQDYLSIFLGNLNYHLENNIKVVWSVDYNYDLN